MIDPETALQRVLDETPVAEPCAAPLHAAAGLRLAEPIAADRDYPPFARSMMDGFAVRLADAGGWTRIVGEVAAGHPGCAAVEDGACVEIMTGAPCPPGTQAVVPKEEVQREGQRVLLPSAIAPDQCIAPPGSECVRGAIVLAPGTMLGPLAIAVAASFGRDRVRVYPRPRMAVITTGGELVPVAAEPGPGQIRDSNGPMLAAMAVQLGLDRPACLHAEDSLESILGALRAVADREVVLLTGGVSAGSYDLVPDAIERFGARRVFHKVAQRPGKPLLFARKGNQVLFGLPGNPLSCHLCFHRYVSAAVRKMSGAPAMPRPEVGRLAAAISARGPRAYFAAARAERAGDEGWRVAPLPARTSADVFTACGANCYIAVPAGATLDAGRTVALSWIDETER